MLAETLVLAGPCWKPQMILQRRLHGLSSFNAHVFDFTQISNANDYGFHLSYKICINIDHMFNWSKELLGITSRKYG